MRKIFSYMICALACFALALPTSAHGDIDQSDGFFVASSTLSPDLDLDSDGIPDYMDSLIDVDGDGIGDAGPIYREPPKESQLKKNDQNLWIVALCVALFVGFLAATVILKVRAKRKKED